jgi:hypothetical protein
VLALGLSSSATASARPVNDPLSLSVPLSETSWIVSGLLQGSVPYRLAPDPWRGLLERFLEPYRNHTPEWRAFLFGAYGPSRRAWLPELCWGPQGCEPETAARAEREAFALPDVMLHEPLWLDASRPALALDWGPRPEVLAVTKRRPCPRWKAPQPIVVLRYAGEREVLALTDCEGALASDALERLSVLARPASTARPELPLPSEPSGEDGEWSPDVRLLHPRLAWAVGEIARSFPARPLVVYSGYRRDGHTSLHRQGRALDLAVVGVTSEELFSACRRLRDVGCGFYPNNRFVHLDVRPYGTGRIAWVDVSHPGEPSRYVDGWPGVLAEGQGWLGGARP